MATILVVDDRPSNRQLLVTLLGYKGHRVVEAADGAEGLIVARTERPDLVITDILMPTMDGYEFVRQLRADPTLTQTPVVFWSAHYLERETHTLASASGVSHILLKPCEPQEVFRTVDAALGYAPTPAAVPAPEAFDREHLRLVTDKLSQQAAELRTTNLKLDALIETGQRLALERDLTRLLQDYCQAARQIIGAQWVVIGMLEADGHTCHHVATAGLTPAQTATISPSQFHEGIFREVIREPRVHRRHGLPGDPQAAGLPPGYPPVHTLLGVAIFSPRRVYGGIYFADKLAADTFREEDERLATTLAAQLAVAYENAQLYRELERRAVSLEQEVAERQRAEEALRASGAHYRLLFDANPHPMWVTDRETRMFLAVNEAAIRHYGYTQDEFLAMRIHDIRPPEDLSTLLEVFAQPAPDIRHERGTWRHRLRDGSLIDVDITVHDVLFAGRPGRLVLAQDITERQRAEAARRRYAERLEILHEIDQAILAEQFPETIVSATIGHIRSLLSCWRVNISMFDWTAHQGIVLGWAGSGTPRFPSGTRVPLEAYGSQDIAALQAGKVYGVEDVQAFSPLPATVQTAQADGLRSYVRMPLLAQGELIGVLNLMADRPGAFTFEDVDVAREVANQLAAALQQARLHAQVQRRAAELEVRVAERQRAEAHVLQQLARLALLHQLTRAIGARQDLHSIFLVVLSRLEQDLPITFGCFCLGTPGSDTVTVTAVGPASQALAATMGLEAQAVLCLDQLGVRACGDGQTVSVLDTAQAALPLLQRFAQAGLRSLIATPLVVEDSLFGLLLAARREPQGFSSVEGEFLRQVSEHVGLAAHQAALYARLQQSYDDLRQSQQVVMQQERLRALGQMASGIAHDINNAISPITLYVESLLASDATLSARARQYLTTVQQAANDVAHTVARLREFYRQPGSPQEALPVDLNQIIPQVVELTRAKWRDEPQRLGRTITVHTVLQAAGLPSILGVESELREALTNLVFNAVDAMPQGGSLTLRTQATPTAVVVEVSDMGIGMDDETRRRCLEPFYTTKDERGTGLGLAMVYGVTERHAAQLVIESAVGQGTTVRLLFPIAVRQGERADQPVEVEASAPSLRILVVDDDPLLRRLLQDVLQTEGHVVTVVEGGRVGLAALQGAQEQQEPFDVVITDLGMPEMDGCEVARGVKQAAPHTPVILLTGWGQVRRQDDALPPHVDHLLSKPPGLRELRAALRVVARPAERKDNHGHS